MEYSDGEIAHWRAARNKGAWVCGDLCSLFEFGPGHGHICDGDIVSVVAANGRRLRGRYQVVDGTYGVVRYAQRELAALSVGDTVRRVDDIRCGDLIFIDRPGVYGPRLCGTCCTHRDPDEDEAPRGCGAYLESYPKDAD